MRTGVTVPFLDLRRQTGELRGSLDAVVACVLDSGVFLGGSEVTAFEEEFATWCGAREAVAVASGTDALELALRAVGVERGHEVITAASTCVPTVAAIVAAGGTPVLADVDPVTYTLDLDSVLGACGPRTRALVPVHLYGQCADLGALLGLARDRGLAVVDDAAQAHGAEFGGRRVGGLCDATAFSFYPTKNLGALGDGGAVVTDDAGLASRIRRLRSYGEDERYRSVESGRNSRLDALQAAVLRLKLARLEGWNERRRELAGRYGRQLAGFELTLPAEAAGTRHAWHLYVVRVQERELLRATLASRGIETLVHYPRALHQHPAYGALARPGLEHSEALAGSALSLPLYPQLRDDEVDRVCAAVDEVLS
ncbi:MAG TPA: DegT/DnrJ/EryC1/StrS family aminotransferase [Gaiellaceae bacterium]|nr:DegT/DnrJ/EryC1/StrS family aminotransferase [Gaiellaceae bacterium]